MVVKGKGEGSPYSLSSVWPGADPDVRPVIHLTVLLGTYIPTKMLSCLIRQL